MARQVVGIAVSLLRVWNVTFDEQSFKKTMRPGVTMQRAHTIKTALFLPGDRAT